MSITSKSRAVDVALAHCEAWSNHDWETARKALAEDVRVSVTTTKPIMPPVNTVGVEAYMEGLREFAGGVSPGTLQLLASQGDDHNALLMVNVEGAFGPGAPPVTLPGARLYLVDDHGKIVSEQVVFLVPD